MIISGRLYTLRIPVIDVSLQDFVDFDVLVVVCFFVTELVVDYFLTVAYDHHPVESHIHS